jgi:hypothetical protein
LAGRALASTEPCFVEPNLVVVPEVTLEAVQKGFVFLVEKIFFAFWKAENWIDQSMWNLSLHD